jgi:gentisate 1,2-dioxygenase
MASITQTEATSLPVSTTDDETKNLLSNLAKLHTKPLWAQMAKLNPPLPNPKTIPYIWKYDEIRPHLLKAGELITEKQAERRVAMLINPARGMSLPDCQQAYLTFQTRRPFHYRYHLCRFAARDAQ